ncbi:MAG: hypothetical protein A2315_11490 [Ignavibacteria bacterium RIFOXYB2_FULL_35_12]|nr:MAG: hypothetical protein A2058_00355 [Ignavibacteria bacterium GWA2_36_19]OGU56333.1 MAG: hypothetical protein A2X60_11805 [Ignavibacteria bacterium GWF2_35_20]OGU87720.1 MAG: hypothetical protein A3K31_03405 [Ignavibacteria bacterium RIFOXYA12_FULL_35_25]OGV01475.1 MAG: hypothetical protein A2455_00210 [Ignavibacteria bacterium RIFOXYC2_FULL_35_16]OGV05710.1 MAG: hypothetical protein A2315_11490 [Ignavibacteria bacterium RIFOXYB2_FULL_35_12]OGV29628.1 MAG: hypothetical protein A2523_15825
MNENNLQNKWGNRFFQYDSELILILLLKREGLIVNNDFSLNILSESIKCKDFLTISEGGQKVIIQLKNQRKSFKISVISVLFADKFYFLVTLMWVS